MLKPRLKLFYLNGVTLSVFFIGLVFYGMVGVVMLLSFEQLVKILCGLGGPVNR